jgi:beta-galactosidase
MFKSCVLLAAACAAILCDLVAVAAPSTARERVLLDAGWKFHRGDFPGQAGAAITMWRWTAEPRNSQADAEGAFPAEQAEAAWKEASPALDVFHGQRGFVWFRATLPDSPRSGRTLHFEGVDDNATVFLNGKRLTHHEGWNEPFDVPLDSAWRAGQPNVLTVLVENTAGAGGIGVADLQIQQPEVASGPAAADYNDHDWRTVHLPHDFVVEGEFTPKADASHGSLPTDVGWYRKTLDVPATDRGKRIWLEFDGVYRNSLVWFNGRLLGNHKSGYIGFRYDITDGVTYGGRNNLVVRCDARAQEGWWYEGGGIYRHVWLNKAASLHIAPDGVFVSSTVRPDGSADVSVQVDVTNQEPGAGEQKFTVSSIIMPIGGKESGEHLTYVPNQPTPVSTTSGGHARIGATVTVRSPRLWSIESPNLYRLVTRVERAGKLVDTVTTDFGVRTIRFDAEKGFFLNDKPVKIQGTCNHQDFAGVGIAMPDSLLEWRIRKLKEMGCNAYRMSHNPPTKELLDACDRLGMLVMDENRHLGDTYRDHTSPGTPYSELTDLRDLILRDRNHASVIMWSMCNEEGLQGSSEGARIFAAMKKVVIDNDPTRPITCAMNGGWGQGISLVEDLQGCNYNPGNYDGFHHAFPDKPAYGSETASAVSTRGEYVNDPVKGYVSAYDVNAPSWAQTAEVAWRALATRPFMAGGYVWTGFDYKGEPTPYGWPCINSHFGIMDECGFPKDTYFYYQSWWTDRDIIHLLPHWNWPDKEGEPIDVWCHSNAEKVELLLNGVSLGVKEMPRFGHLEWKVPYAPGKLEAKGYRGGKVVSTDVVETTGAPAQLRLSTDRNRITPDGECVTMVTVSVLDEKGRIVPYASDEITFSVVGPAAVAGVGNGDPSSHEPDRASRRRAFHGLALAVIQATDRPGKIELTAAAPGLKSASIALQSVK